MEWYIEAFHRNGIVPYISKISPLWLRRTFVKVGVSL